ncbi:N-alpha-acetyltransferase RimI [Austwickia sp. TVS 96-490-7B]|uniref:ribosomal protein S18-alanine N-acetyltransferase n=1 Tax=Austwickia sp. TVS 96-490-7B TaxID=2830843 RepID=UPI001C58C23A|nr:ribosomal protein S18-alanine N-acetyltransferase [Austwickia sp. TVS 96-490-7B]MBW3085656.1 N-alpha-acetyltransferase RimI [Austwickia sp. TVS 96-490-7B]
MTIGACRHVSEPALRAMSWTDIPEVAAAEQHLFADHPWDQATWWAELAGRPRRSYVVLRGEGGTGALKGYAGLDLGAEVADVMTIGVTPSAQGTGCGRRLMEWSEQTARSAGADYLMLEVRADNAAAIGLYRSRGFRELSVRRRYYQPGDVDALILRKDLRA